MRKTSPIPVRLTDQQIERIDSVAESIGESRAGVIKMCVMGFLSRFEREGVSMLPPDWTDMLKQMDGRTHRYTEPVSVVMEQHGQGNSQSAFSSTSAAPTQKNVEYPPEKRAVGKPKSTVKKKGKK